MNKKQTAISTVMAQMKEVRLAGANNYQLHFKEETEYWSIDSLKDLCRNVLASEQYPEFIVLPNSLLIKWNTRTAESFAQIGRISQQQFMQLSLVQRGGES
ncbi:hypothetical protein E9993_14675 [Labilibacter sediminis]|nr:hypothetical protein E9993_14675 [Labilibacter sediminis]